MKLKKATLIRTGAVFILVIGIVAVFAATQTANYTQLPPGGFAENLSRYSNFGIEYVGTEYNPDIPGSGRGKLYYNGQLVKQFVDRKDTDDILTYKDKEGDGITVYTVYDENGRLSGVEKR
jgi:hypothetical protein